MAHLTRRLGLKLAGVLARTILVTLLVGTADITFGAQIPFIPPNDPVGHVVTTNANDGYAGGRGVVFSMLNDVAIDSVGIYLDVTGLVVSYSIAQVTSTTGQVTSGETILDSGSAAVTTNGLQWVDFHLARRTLLNGEQTTLEFTFSGNANQNFFYNNNNVTFTTGDFQLLDGTQGGNTNDFLMPAVRVNTVPEPDGLALAGLGFLGLAWIRIRRARAARCGSTERNGLKSVLQPFQIASLFDLDLESH